MRLAVAGLGRSGLAVARAARRRGWPVVVLDRSTEAALAKPELLREAREEGIEVRMETATLAGVKADRLVANPAVPRTAPIFEEAQDRGIEIISEPEFAFGIARAPIVAVTGTNGKSTTVAMTWHILREAGLDARLCGNIMGSGFPETTLTEAADDAPEAAVLIAEISSYQLEWTREFRPSCAAITNIRPDHLDRYASFEEYAETKRKIFRCMAAPDRVVYTANDENVRPPGAPNVAYRPRARRGGAAEVRDEDAPVLLSCGSLGEHGEMREDGLRILDTLIPYGDLAVTAEHDYRNAVMAALLGHGLMEATGRADPVDRKLDPGIAQGLRTFPGLRHRMEWVGERGGVRFINNSMCTNPAALISSVQSVKDPAHLLIGGVNKGLDFAPVAHYLANRRHRVYLYGRDGGTLAEGLGGTVFDDLGSAFRAAAAAARPGEVVMLSPGMASQDQFPDFQARGDLFVQLAREAGAR